MLMIYISFYACLRFMFCILCFLFLRSGDKCYYAVPSSDRRHTPKIFGVDGKEAVEFMIERMRFKT